MVRSIAKLGHQIAENLVAANKLDASEKEKVCSSTIPLHKNRPWYEFRGLEGIMACPGVDV